jgi:hypothetical protein
VATTKKNTLIREFGRANLVNADGFAKNHGKGCIRFDNLNNILAIWVNRLNAWQFVGICRCDRQINLPDQYCFAKILISYNHFIVNF